MIHKTAVIDSNAKISALQMGCYGIGVSRIIAAAIEQNYDDKGIIWPKSISPFDAVIIEIDGNKDDKIRSFSKQVYNKLSSHDVEVMLDDRDAKLGKKLNDWELVGIPSFIIIGKTEVDNKKITFKKRGDKDKVVLGMDELLTHLED